MLRTGRLNKRRALEEMDPEDLVNFWLLYQLEPFCIRSEEMRLGQAAGAIAGKDWFEIFPGDQGENIPKLEAREKPKAVDVDQVVAHWKLHQTLWNETLKSEAEGK